MSNDVTLDIDDPHEAHALFAMEFRCESCKIELVSVSDEQPFSNAWYRDLASLAKKKR